MYKLHALKDKDYPLNIKLNSVKIIKKYIWIKNYEILVCKVDTKKTLISFIVHYKLQGKNMEDRLLDYIALGLLVFVVLTIIYGGMYIHDIPYQMAKKRNHPHTEAIHTACWVSLLVLHIIWPFLWIWAALYKPDVGWDMGSSSNNNTKLKDEIKLLEERMNVLEEKLVKKED